MMNDKLVEATVLALQGKLTENNNYIYCYRSIGLIEFDDLLDKKDIIGRYNNSNENQNNSNLENVVCFFKDKIMWRDASHEILIRCRFNTNEVIESGTGQYWASKDFAKTKVWTGRRGTVSYDLNEIYVYSYSLNNVLGFYGGLDTSIAEFLTHRFNDTYANLYIDKLKKLGYDVNALP